MGRTIDRGFTHKIADCTSAGLARSGSVREITIDKDVLYKAFQNTCELIKEMCELKD